MSDVFLSYSRADKPFILQLKQLIEDEGYLVWFDQTEIISGDDWWLAIEAGIREARAYLVVMTPDSEQSKRVKREFLLAESIGLPIIPVLRSGNGFSYISNVQYIEMLADTYTEIPQNLKKSLAKHLAETSTQPENKAMAKRDKKRENTTKDLPSNTKPDERSVTPKSNTVKTAGEPLKPVEPIHPKRDVALILTIIGVVIAAIGVIFDLLFGFGIIFSLATSTPAPATQTVTITVSATEPSPIATETPTRTPTSDLAGAIETWLLEQGYAIDDTLLGFAENHAAYLASLSSVDLGSEALRCEQNGQTIDDIGLGYREELILIVISSTQHSINIEEVQSKISPILSTVSATKFGHYVYDATFQNVAIILSVGDRNANLAACYSEKID